MCPKMTVDVSDALFNTIIMMVLELESKSNHTLPDACIYLPLNLNCFLTF